MNIILVSRAGRRRQFDTTRWRFTLPMAAVAVLAAATLFTGGFYAAHYLGASAPLAQISAWKTRLAADQREIAAAKNHAQANIDALSGRLGEMQAHIIRLDALGRQLIKMAGIDPAEFNFGAPPAEGGPIIDAPDPDAAKSDLLDGFSQLSDAIRSRSQQLSALENLLMHRNLQKAMHPAGRPIKGGWISSYFGRRVDPITGEAGFHPGIDFAGKRGTKVHAIAAGIVTWAGPWYGYGNLVEIDDGHGYATRYGHNEKILVKVGEAVSKGQVISLMGSTGHSTGPHVHLEVLYHGREINPLKFVRGDG
ncbi:MAG TPA: M23 family metallopeptidase [Gammaproteobacteria bacterium]|nr:M23 family metallopeptidase [Gammaproteobacteria bacterium]